MRGSSPRMTNEKDRSAMTQIDKLLSRKEAGVGIVTFNNPGRLNAVSLDMWEAAKRGAGRLRCRQ
jgi:enoyl-CoA hydratase/carnithine racemase